MNAHKKCVFTLFVLSVSECVKGVVVYTENGGVSGTTFTTFQGRVVDAFLGIPYAKPPVKENRFRDPQPAEKWRGIRSAQSYGDKCMQYIYYREKAIPVHGSEDCLFLNIYTPNPSNTSRLNVIVFIHGGCFMLGQGKPYTPYYILDNRDLVFVTLNYRLGPLGFLSTEDNVIPGNFGLKDQVMALKWIRNNIEHFGGDRNKITITGNSAGGVSVHMHYMSPLSRGLFKNGISESGTALDPWALTENPLQKAKILSAAAGCPTNTSKDILECLRSKDAVSILIPTRLFLPWFYNPFTPFGPVVEPKSENAFLSENPYKIISEGRVKDVPWMTYITTDEGLYPASTFINNHTLMQELDENWDTIAPHLLDYNFTVPADRLVEVSRKIRQHYLGDSKIDNDSRDGLVKLMSDRIFGVGAEKTVRLQASVSKSPVYFFVFGYRSGVSITKAFCHCDDYFGVSHTDSTTYLMNTGLVTTNYSSGEEKKTVDAMVNIWLSFTNSSVPFASKNFYIPPVSPDIGEEGNLTFFLLTSSHDIKNTVDLTNRRFWDSLGLMENENASVVEGNGDGGIIKNVGVISGKISNNLLFIITIKLIIGNRLAFV